MEERRCPLCKGMLLDNVCIDCGFESLEEKDISAPYDFNPLNDRFGEPEQVEEWGGMESISSADVNVSVLPPAEELKLKRNANNAPAYNHRQNTPQNFQQNIPQNFQQNVQSVQQPASLGEVIISDITAVIKKHWWKLVLMIISPALGMLIGCVHFTIARFSRDNQVIFTNVLKGLAYLVASIVMNKFGFGFIDLNWLLDLL